MLTSKTLISNRIFLFTTIAALVLPVVIILGINLYHDPFELFTIDKKNPGVFLGGRGKDRYQHPGTLRQYQPKSIVLGNSLAANFLPSKIESILGWNETYSVTLDGGTLYEQRQVLRLALRVSDIENVLWLISPKMFELPFDRKYSKLIFPEYLYNSRRLDDIRLYLTLPSEVTKHTVMRRIKRKAIAKESANRKVPIDFRDRSTEWMTLHNKRFNNPDYVARRILGNTISNPFHAERLLKTPPLGASVLRRGRLNPSASSSLEQHLGYNIIPSITRHPETYFTLILQPPFPLLTWQHLKITNPNVYLARLLLVRDIVKALSPYPNVSLFAYGLEPFTKNLNLYKDKWHYHMRINNEMLSRISQGKNRLDEYNVISYLQRFDNEVTHYNAKQEVSKWR